MTLDEARKMDPWSPAYLEAQAKARAMVDAMTFSEREDKKRAYNRSLPRNWRIKMDGGLVRHMTTAILAGIDP